MSKAAASAGAGEPREWFALVLRGVGQVMFQEHAGTGALFLLGIALASPWMLLGAVIGATVGPLIGWLLPVARRDVQAGLYGFNSTLVGIALLFYLEPRPLTWLLVVGGAVGAALVTWLCRRGLPFPTYTAPFIVTTWAIWVLVDGAGWELHRAAAAPPRDPAGFLSAVLAGEAEEMFGATAATGVCFVLGIAISNFRQAAAALAGSALGTLVAAYRHDPAQSIWIGIYGYNASLAAMAAYLARPGLLAPALAASVSVPLVDWAGAAWGVPALTAPFVLAAWILLALLAAERRLAMDPRDPT
ncbi:MAG: urea transporter [Planctomycetaceae bacterium]|nr:urea transporter [Planctomycetaceae bacterium]